MKMLDSTDTCICNLSGIPVRDRTTAAAGGDTGWERPLRRVLHRPAQGTRKGSELHLSNQGPQREEIWTAIR